MKKRSGIRFRTPGLVTEKLPIILTFHKSTSSPTPSVSNYAPHRINRLLTFLRNEVHCRFVPLKPVEPTTSRSLSLAISFDDAYRHLRDILPRLQQECAIVANVFIPTAFVGKAADWDYCPGPSREHHLAANEIQSLSQVGVRFGTHGATHVDLTRCNKERLRAEILDSKKSLEDITGCAVDSISYPFGCVSERVVDCVREAGYVFGLTTNYPRATDQPLSAGRVAIHGFDTLLSVRRKIQPGLCRRFENWKTGLTSRLAHGTILLNRLRGHQP